MSTKHSIALTAIAAALALPLGSAEAAVIGSFDPGFPFVATGAPTNNLGYRGTITFDLSAGCAGASGYISSGTNGCTFTTLSTTIDFYNAALYSHPTASQILTSTTLTGAQIGTDIIYGAYFDPVTGNVTAFDSFTSNNIYVSVTDNTPGAQIHYNDATTGATPGDTSTYSDYLNLYFQSGYVCNSNCGYGYGYGATAAMYASAAELTTQAGPTGGQGSVNPQAFMIDTSDSGTITSNAATVTVTTTAVPEPESAALALIGLGAIAATRRRRSKPEPRDAFPAD